jgi:hypothetical protein
MNWKNLAKTVVLAGAVMLASSAFASNKGKLHLAEAAQVNGQQLAPGDYQIQWDGTGNNVDLSIAQGKKVVAKTAAKVVELPNASPYDAAVIDRSGGTSELSGVRFAGKKVALTIGGGEKAEMSGGSSR